MAPGTPGLPGTPRDFRTTRWSVVLSAGHGAEAPARAALETLCASYWYPLYAFARRRGASADDAEDLVQGFFARLLEKGELGRADPGKGRFRAFLLTAFGHFAANERDRAAALKRGGDRARVPLDASAAGARYELTDPELSPERLFERAWALALLDDALGELRRGYAARGREELFEALKGTLTGDGTAQGYAALGEQLGMGEGAVKVAAHRLRERYREALKRAVADTVADPGDVEDELRALFRALG